jgi:hypothetical protein
VSEMKVVQLHLLVVSVGVVCNVVALLLLLLAVMFFYTCNGCSFGCSDTGMVGGGSDNGCGVGRGGLGK